MFDHLIRTSGPNTHLTSFTRSHVSQGEDFSYRMQQIARFTCYSFLFSLTTVALFAVATGTPNDISIATIVLLLVLVCFVWLWANTFRCPECDSALSIAVFGRLPRWCAKCGQLVKPEELWCENARLEIDAELVASETDLVVRCLKSLLLLCIYDKVDEVVFYLTGSDYKLYALVGETKVELEPPPVELHCRIVKAAKALCADASQVTSSNSKGLQKIRIYTDRGSAIVATTISRDNILSFRFSYPAVPKTEKGNGDNERNGNGSRSSS